MAPYPFEPVTKILRCIDFVFCFLFRSEPPRRDAGHFAVLSHLRFEPADAERVGQGMQSGDDAQARFGSVSERTEAAQGNTSCQWNRFYRSRLCRYRPFVKK